MSAGLASQRYLQRHIEPGLPPSPQPLTPWRHVLVIPACRERADLLQRLPDLPAGAGQALVILVLNRPDSDADPEANSALRAAVLALPAGSASRCAAAEHPGRPVPAGSRHSGGAAPGSPGRGAGAQVRLRSGVASGWARAPSAARWICSTDADATLPPGYFQQLENLPAGAAGATFPFWHAPGEDASCNLATALYELRLHHYVRGLEYAGSPYAFHTLGSCLAVAVEGYAQVRGFPKTRRRRGFLPAEQTRQDRPGDPAGRRLHRAGVTPLATRALRHRRGSGKDQQRIGPADAAAVLSPCLLCSPARRAGGGRATRAAGTRRIGPPCWRRRTSIRCCGRPAAIPSTPWGSRRRWSTATARARRRNSSCASSTSGLTGCAASGSSTAFATPAGPNCSLAELDGLTPGLWPPGGASGIDDAAPGLSANTGAGPCSGDACPSQATRRNPGAGHPG